MAILENFIAFQISEPYVWFWSALNLMIFQEFMMKFNSMHHTYVGQCSLSVEVVIWVFLGGVTTFSVCKSQKVWDTLCEIVASRRLTTNPAVQTWLQMSISCSHFKRTFCGDKCFTLLKNWYMSFLFSLNLKNLIPNLREPSPSIWREMRVLHWRIKCKFPLWGLILKGKVIPLHAMEALGVKGGIATTHS
jgi:hypothetical protein